MPPTSSTACLLAAMTLWAVAVGCEPVAVQPVATPAATRSVPTIAVQTTTVERTSTQPATVHAYHEARAFAKASGFVSQLNVDIGSKVKQGDVLAVLSVPEIDAQMKRETASLARLQAGVTQAEAQIAVAKSAVVAADSARQQALADQQRAAAQWKADQAEHQRVSELVKQQAVASRLLDEATNRMEAAEAAQAAAAATTAAAAAEVEVARARQTAAEADLLAAQADVQVGQMRLKESQTLLGYAELRSPFDGTIIERNVELGDLVRNSQTGQADEPLLVIAQTDRVRMRVAVPERDAPLTNVGDIAQITMPALPGETFSGPIARIAGGLDPRTRTMLVEIDLPNTAGKLIPGMFGQAKILLEAREQQVSLPASAVRYDEQGRSYVYVVDGEDTIQVVDVATGVDDGLTIEITSGLSGGQRVVGPLLQGLTAGQKVHVEG